MSHRIWNRGSNGLPKLVQPYVPAILFPVRHSVIGPGILLFVPVACHAFVIDFFTFYEPLSKTVEARKSILLVLFSFTSLFP